MSRAIAGLGKPPHAGSRSAPGEPGRLELWTLAVIVAGALVLSGIRPHDRLTWVLEVSWVAAGLPLAVLTRRRFPLTGLLYRLLAVHALVLILGGHYTYEHVPLGNWARDAFDLARNHYDRLGHFAQGFVPAVLIRELLIRRTALRTGGWLFVLVSGCCLGFSALFEMIEWWAAIALGSDADAYLATQGDRWDTQWDMFLALIGSIVAQALLSRRHDRELTALAGSSGASEKRSRQAWPSED